MSQNVKFASQLDARVLKELREYAREHGKTLSGVLTAAVEDFLQRERIRPAFRAATESVIDEHAELLQRLAR